MPTVRNERLFLAITRKLGISWEPAINRVHAVRAIVGDLAVVRLDPSLQRFVLQPIPPHTWEEIEARIAAHFAEAGLAEAALGWDAR